MPQNINRAVKRALDASKECKQFEGFTSSPVGNSATIYAIHDDIVLGTQANERVGNRIKMERFRAHIEIYKSPAATTSVARVILVESKLAELLLTSDVLTSDNFNSNYSLQTLSTGDFRIVCDKFMILDNYHPTASFVLNAKLREYVQWRGNTSTPASNAGGGLFLFLISDATSNAPTFRVKRALCYKD